MRERETREMGERNLRRRREMWEREKKIRGTCGGGGGRREREKIILNRKVKVKNIILMI
jgi:hypothetical protein